MKGDKNMKKVALSVITAMFICIYALSLGQAVAEQNGDSAQSAQAAGNIEPMKAHILIEDQKDNPEFVILDVRTPGEYSGGHIENAVNIDHTGAAFSDEIGKLDRSKTYLVYCRTGRRSKAAAGQMEELGFVNVINMEGGITEWQDAGLPVTK